MKILLLFIFVFAFVFNANAQDGTSTSQDGFNAGVSLGLPTGDTSDFFSFSIIVDLNYMWNVSDSFDVGIATGLVYVFGKDWKDGEFTIEVEDGQYLPLAVAGRLSISENFSIIADIGYALGLNDGNDGGFYYRPGVAYNISDNTNINLTYTGVSDVFFDYGSINIGVGFRL